MISQAVAFCCNNMQAKDMEVQRELHNIAAVYSASSKILILGSFPSRKSRERKFFYSHPSNRFRPMMEELFEVSLDSIDTKKAFLLKNDIALWDVIKECDIKGSSDSSIENIISNDISALIKKTQLKRIYLNGKKAEEVFYKYNTIDIATTTLPSASSQNASYSKERLIDAWFVIKDYFDKLSIQRS